MDDLIGEFLTETKESLDALDTDIIRLEQNPEDKDLIGRIFRLVHTVKGTCGFLGLPRLEKVAHHSENIMGRYRDGSLKIVEYSVSVILESFDRIKEIVDGIAETGSEPDGDDSVLIEKLDAIFEGREAGSVAVSDDKPAEEAPAEEEFVPVMAESAMKEQEAAQESTPAIVTQEDKVEETKAELAKVNKKPVEDKTLRVSVSVLEQLMTTVSELVLSRNQIMQILRDEENSPFLAPLQRLNHVVSELQESVMQTRMQPVGNAWNKLPRIVRDLSVELKKKINLEMRGQDTELDRQVLELIKDPLTHMVRNSGDHGIGIPADRVAAGKPEEGTILLNAFHEGGHIIIEISDDGRGLCIEQIKKKALEKEVYTEDQLNDMTDTQIQQIIFAAGFSTAEKVTSVSGRGVGMDVVRTNIEKIGGNIELKSVEGKGSTFTIKIPLTLAIVSALIVKAGSERYAIPQISVKELVRLSNTGENKLEEIKGAPIMRLRDRLLPLISLSDLLELEDEAVETVLDDEGNEIEIENKDDSKQVIVAQVGANNFGIIVDRVYDTEEIVVKPVSPMLKNIKMFSGNTILGDGSVIMILDPNGIANAMGNINDSEIDTALGSENHSNMAIPDSERKTSLLIFKAGEGAPRAVPLSLVARLEDIDIKNIEVSGRQRVVQYRDKLMPLILFSESMIPKTEGHQSVLVFSDRERSMGLMVDEIIDIVEERVDVQIASEDNLGLLGSAIIEGQAMDVVDVGHFLSVSHSDWFSCNEDGTFEDNSSIKKRILLVDDSPFFRNMISPMLSIAGYTVVSTNSAIEALALCDAGEKFDIIISDIEMPEMNGYDFAKKIKSGDSGWKDVPIVALSSHATQSDLERGKTAGFTDYVAKFDRDALLRSISQIGDAA